MTIVNETTTKTIPASVSIEAEQCVLGGLMLDNSRWPEVAGIVQADDFSRDDHRLIFHAVQHLAEKGSPFDVVTIGEHLESAGTLDKANGLPYLGILSRDTPSAANIVSYAQIVCRKALERRLADAHAKQDTQLAVAIQDQLEALQSGIQRHRFNPPVFAGFARDEVMQARLHPKPIVTNYLYANLALLAAAGGTGKTTTMIYEAVNIALGRDVWGCRVENPGKTLFVTAEDPRELFAARLWQIVESMDLSEYEQHNALGSIDVWDVSCGDGGFARLAELDAGGNIQLTALADRIVETYKGTRLAQVVFDPVVSFGPGERLVNDGEQAVVMACRRIIGGLGCAVRLVHHTGKVNGRAGAIDQYAARGGTALPDGCRMVAIMAPVTDDLPNQPAGFQLQPGESGYILARPKLSFAPPQPNIWIRRRGYTFEHFIEEKLSAEQRLDADAELVADFIKDELAHGRKHTRRSLEELCLSKLPLSRGRLRAALSDLSVSGILVEKDLPRNEQQGRRKTHLIISRPETGAMPAQYPASEKTNAPPSINAPPYRDNINGAIDAMDISHTSLDAASDNGAIPAQWRNRDDKEGF